MVKEISEPVTIQYKQFVLRKDHKINVKNTEKVWDFDFNKRAIIKLSEDHIDTLPYGY